MKLVHGGDLTSYHQQFPQKEVLDFSANINPLGIAEGVRRAYLACIEQCAHYPDPLCRELRAAIGGFEGVPEEWVLCANGASDLICRIAWALQPKTALLLAPTFADYERSLAAAGCAIRYHMLAEEQDFQLQPAILQDLDGIDLLFLCNPNNPTGSVIDPNLMEQIVQQCQARGIYLIVDECFLDFLPDGEAYSCKRYLQQSDHLLILRAFTKIFAIPGLRLGYLLSADAPLLACIAHAGPTWAVSVPAQRCGVAAIQESADLAKLRRLLPQWRRQIEQGLDALGCKVYPSSANYLLFRTKKGLADAVRPHGILLRDCANYVGLCAGYYRTAVRTESENAVLLAVLQTVCNQ